MGSADGISWLAGSVVDFGTGTVDMGSMLANAKSWLGKRPFPVDTYPFDAARLFAPG